MIDVETFIKSQEPGTAIFGRFSMTLDEELETGFFIREEKKHIDTVPGVPDVYFKAVMFENNGIIPVAVLIRIEGIVKPYDTWWNFQAKRVREYFDDIISQDHVIAHLYSDQKREKSIKVKNTLQEPFKKFKEKIIQTEPWVTDQFIHEYKEIRKKYQNVLNMWNLLSKPNSEQKFSNN